MFTLINVDNAALRACDGSRGLISLKRCYLKVQAESTTEGVEKLTATKKKTKIFKKSFDKSSEEYSLWAEMVNVFAAFEEVWNATTSSVF